MVENIGICTTEIAERLDARLTDIDLEKKIVTCLDKIQVLTDKIIDQKSKCFDLLITMQVDEELKLQRFLSEQIKREKTF